MGAESRAEKAARLLAAGALKITAVNGETIAAHIQGDSGLHRLGYRKGSGWWCSCPLREVGRRGEVCAHIMALAKVAARTARQQRGLAG